MNEELTELFVSTGKLEALIKYLEKHPTELGGNNKVFREALQEEIDLITKVTEVESV